MCVCASRRHFYSDHRRQGWPCAKQFSLQSLSQIWSAAAPRPMQVQMKICGEELLACGKARRQEPREGERAREEQFIPVASMSCKLDIVFFSIPGTARAHAHAHAHACTRTLYQPYSPMISSYQGKIDSCREKIDLRMLSSTSSVSSSFCYQMVATGIED